MYFFFQKADVCDQTYSENVLLLFTIIYMQLFACKISTHIFSVCYNTVFYEKSMPHKQ